MIAHGDDLDYETYVVQSPDITTDVERLEAFVMDAGRTMGGGDGGEVNSQTAHCSRFRCFCCVCVCVCVCMCVYERERVKAVLLTSTLFSFTLLLLCVRRRERE